MLCDLRDTRERLHHATSLLKVRLQHCHERAAVSPGGKLLKYIAVGKEREQEREMLFIIGRLAKPESSRAPRRFGNRTMFYESDNCLL